MTYLMGPLVPAAALLLAAGLAHAAEVAPPRANPVVVRPAAEGRAVQPLTVPRSNLDPLRGPVANQPGAYPSEALEMQPQHTWKGYSAN
ncbi:hypothetical protein KF840_14515 [bacterium]|nr:hypothetical protein [bacterium]